MASATVSATTALHPARPRSREFSERTLGFIMLAPMTLLLLGLVGYPLISSLILSLYRVNLANPEQGQPFVGLGNYLFAFQQPDFWFSVERTFYFTLISVGLELALGILFAVLLNERFRGQLPARLAMIAPWALLTVSNGVLWAWILNPTYGVANSLLMQFGILHEPKAWLSDTFWTMNVIILADVWKTVPNMTLLLLAGLQPIPDDLYEAADVDGATRCQKLTHITLPMLRPVILVLIPLRNILSFRFVHFFVWPSQFFKIILRIIEIPCPISRSFAAVQNTFQRGYGTVMQIGSCDPDSVKGWRNITIEGFEACGMIAAGKPTGIEPVNKLIALIIAFE